MDAERWRPRGQDIDVDRRAIIGFFYLRVSSNWQLRGLDDFCFLQPAGSPVSITSGSGATVDRVRAVNRRGVKRQIGAKE